MENILKQIKQQDWIGKFNGLMSKAKESLSRTDSIIGLDIGTTSVKLVQIMMLDGEWTLVKTALVEIEPDNDSDSRALAGPAALAALKKAFAGIDTRGARIVCGVNCPKTCVRKIIVPRMPKGELAEAVLWEAKNRIPFSLDDAAFDYELSGEIVDKGVKKFNMTLAASPKATIDGLLSYFISTGRKSAAAFTPLGVRIASIVPVSFALQKLIEKNRIEPNKTIAVVDLGASAAELNIFKDARLDFSRKIPLGGADITQSLTGALVSAQGRVELGLAEAEKIKRKIGIPQRGSDPGQEAQIIEGKIAASQILSLLRPVVEQLANEIERSFDFYREEAHGGMIDQIILLGGGGRLKGLEAFLEEEIGIKVAVGDPLKEIKVLPEASAEGTPLDKYGSHRFGAALGAALSETKGFDIIPEKGINLLPAELKEETRRFIERVSLKAVATALLMSLLLFYIGLQIQSSAYDRKIKALELEYRTLVPKLQDVQKKMLASQILKGRPYWEDVLKEISNVIPSNIYLTHLSMEDDIVNLKGVLSEGGQTAESSLSDFMLTLEKGIFKNVRLITIQQLGDDALRSNFEIECRID